MSDDHVVSLVESMHDNFWGGWPSEGELASFLAGLRVAEWNTTETTVGALNEKWSRIARAVEARLSDDGVVVDLSRV